MDVIILENKCCILYRTQGTHNFTPGENGVLLVNCVDIEPPPAARRVIVGNISGRFDSPFYHRGYESVLLK